MQGVDSTSASKAEVFSTPWPQRNKEKMFEIEMAKVYGQEFVDKIKMLPDETTHDDIICIM